MHNHDHVPDLTSDLGTVGRDQGRPCLRYTRRLAQPPEKVWRALTDSEHLRHWLPCDIVGERREGAPIELPFWPDHVERYGIETPVVSGTIHRWRPHELFEWSWDTDRLRFELERVDGGTLLRFTTWIGQPQAHGVGGSPDDEQGTASAAAGYHVCLDHLRLLLNTGRTTPLIDADPGQLQQRYLAEIASAWG